MLLIGDFNPLHLLGNATCETTHCWQYTRNFVLENNTCCLNARESFTYGFQTHGTTSSTDVSLCTADTVNRVKWVVSDDLYTVQAISIL